jgi:hypothetical protein
MSRNIGAPAEIDNTRIHPDNARPGLQQVVRKRSRHDVVHIKSDIEHHVVCVCLAAHVLKRSFESNAGGKMPEQRFELAPVAKRGIVMVCSASRQDKDRWLLCSDGE